MQVLALQMVSNLTKRAPGKVQKETPIVVPAVTPCMNDSKKEVAEQAYTTMGDVCKVCGALTLLPMHWRRLIRTHTYTA